MSDAILSALRRRGGAAPAWTPADGTPLFWVDARAALAAGRLWQDSAKTTPTTAPGDPVGAWVQEGGLTPDLLQATGTARGTLAALSSGIEAVAFDGTDDRLSSAQVTTAGAKTLAFLFQYPVTIGAVELDVPMAIGGGLSGQFRMVVGGVSASFPRLSWQTDNVGTSAYVGTNGFTPDTGVHSVVIVYNGGTKTSTASYRVWVDGVEQVMVTRATSTATGTTSVGASSTGVNPSAIEIARVALMGGDLSSIVSDVIAWVEAP